MPITQSHSPKQSPSGTNINNFNEEAFKTELCELDWSFVTENNDINLGFETFLCFINKTLDKHAPIKTVKKKRKQNNIQAVDN